jgi:hypothetical protein
MGEVSTIGLDIAKSVFQVHGVGVDGAVVIRKRVSRVKVLEFFTALPPCLVGIEACPSAHHWSRKLQILGHTVKLMPPSYVKAYLKRSKNDANDAAAICEAVTRPSMRFVPTKSEQQQSGLMLHRSRQLVVRQRALTAVEMAAVHGLAEADSRIVKPARPFAFLGSYSRGAPVIHNGKPVAAEWLKADFLSRRSKLISARVFQIRIMTRYGMSAMRVLFNGRVG